MLLAGFLAYRVSPLGIGPVRAEIASIEGELLLDGTEPLAAGAILERDQVVRTTSRSGAVLQLADGSRVELAERSVLRLDRRRDGTVLNLEQGGLIVEASEQRGNDHLYVRTNDCLVSVTGTIFSVSHGAKGSRVSVLRGEVQIEKRNGGGGTNMEPAVLRSGDQFTSRVDLAHVPLDHDVRWSRDASRYREDIAALRQIGHELDRALASPARTSTRLLDLLPASTAVYVAVPNVSASLGEAWDRLREQTDANPALAAWWAEHVGANGETAIEDALSELRTLGAHLGPEAVAAVVADPSLAPNTPTVPPAEPEDTHDPVVLAEVLNPAAFSPVLDAEIARFNQRSGQAHLANTAHAPTLRRVQSVPAGAAVDHEILVWLRGDLLLISSEPSLLAAIDAVAGGQPNGFVGSSFHARLASIYREGAGWVAGLDARSALARYVHRVGAGRRHLRRPGSMVWTASCSTPVPRPMRPARRVPRAAPWSPSPTSATESPRGWRRRPPPARSSSSLPTRASPSRCSSRNRPTCSTTSFRSPRAKIRTRSRPWPASRPNTESPSARTSRRPWAATSPSRSTDRGCRSPPGSWWSRWSTRRGCSRRSPSWSTSGTARSPIGRPRP